MSDDTLGKVALWAVGVALWFVNVWVLVQGINYFGHYFSIPTQSFWPMYIGLTVVGLVVRRAPTRADVEAPMDPGWTLVVRFVTLVLTVAWLSIAYVVAGGG